MLSFNIPFREKIYLLNQQEHTKLEVKVLNVDLILDFYQPVCKLSWQQQASSIFKIILSLNDIILEKLS